MAIWLGLLLMLAAAPAGPIGAQAAEIKLISTIGVRSANVLKRQIEGGDPFALPIRPAPPSVSEAKGLEPGRTFQPPPGAPSPSFRLPAPPGPGPPAGIPRP